MDIGPVPGVGGGSSVQMPDEAYTPTTEGLPTGNYGDLAGIRDFIVLLMLAYSCLCPSRFFLLFPGHDSSPI